MSRELGPSLTRKQVADLVSVHPATVSRWAKRGILPHFLTPTGQVRFLRSDVEALMRTHAEAS
jgi:excisionase family DNA binding protein